MAGDWSIAFDVWAKEVELWAERDGVVVFEFFDLAGDTFGEFCSMSFLTDFSFSSSFLLGFAFVFDFFGLAMSEVN